MSFVRATDRLFFAVRPDEETAARVCTLRRDLCTRHGLIGTRVRREHLHVTLHHVGDAAEPPPAEVIQTLARRASYLEMPPFNICFNGAKSLSGGAFVLFGDEGVAGLEALSLRLGELLIAPGMRRPRPFMPHMTLIRSLKRLPPIKIEPITWRAIEVVLVHSLLGRTTHIDVARIPLVWRRK